MNEADFNIQEPGKGKNMFLSFGIAIATGAESVGLIDADIRTFHRIHLERLLICAEVTVQNSNVTIGNDFILLIGPSCRA